MPDIERKREPESLNSPIRIKNRIYRITEKGNSVISQPFYGKDSDFNHRPLITEDQIFVDKKRLLQSVNDGPILGEGFGAGI